MKLLRRLCLALALASGLSLTAAGVSNAATPERDSAKASASVLACPPEGTRFKSPATDGDRIFLVGPKSFLYYIPTQADYENLWGGWDGIIIFNRTACDKTAYPLRNAHLAKLPSSPEVYIYDATFSPPCYRRIKDWATFTTKYHFDPAEIQSQGIIGPLCGDWT